MASIKRAPECPICLESLDPPKRIFQCSAGHFLCETCRINPAIKWCPTCRGPIVGRNIGMEQVLQEFCGVSDNLPQNPGLFIQSSKQRQPRDEVEEAPIVQRAQLRESRALIPSQKMASHLGQLWRPGSSLRRDSHIGRLRNIESQLLNIHLGRGMETPSQRMARRPGEMRGVGTSNASENGGSSTTSYSVNNGVDAIRLLTIARGRGLHRDSLHYNNGVKKPGGLMDKKNKE